MNTFQEITLRLKQQLGMETDEGVGNLLGLTKSAFSERKKRGSFPRDKLFTLAGKRPDLLIDVNYVLGEPPVAMPAIERQNALQDPKNLTTTESWLLAVQVLRVVNGLSVQQAESVLKDAAALMKCNTRHDVSSAWFQQAVAALPLLGD